MGHTVQVGGNWFHLHFDEMNSLSISINNQLLTTKQKAKSPISRLVAECNTLKQSVGYYVNAALHSKCVQRYND